MIVPALASRTSELFAAGLPETARVAASRSLLNVIGTAIGGCRHPAVDIVVNSALRYGGAPAAPVPGRPERLDAPNAALAIGVAAHLDDFDDTHLATVVHPAASVLAAALPSVSSHDAAGWRLLDAAALGIETELRVAAAMSPDHYDAGWHITGTVGVIGATVTTALLRGLDSDRLAMAIGLATSMTLGHREAFGTMLKPFHPGKAAANGLLATALAQKRFTASTTALEGPRGYFAVLTPKVDLESIAADLGTRWLLLDNTFKPYPCGIVSHPAIEAAEGVAPLVRGASIAAIRVMCHPLVTELTGNPAPVDGLQARFSTIHGVAVALADGSVGLPQYYDRRVRAPDVTRLRSLVTLIPDDGIGRDSAIVEVDVEGGGTITRRAEHVRGSLARPLTDQELNAKVTSLIDLTWPGHAQIVMDAVTSLREMNTCQPLLDALTRTPGS